jgi:hypothetical protein
METGLWTNLKIEIAEMYSSMCNSGYELTNPGHNTTVHSILQIYPLKEDSKTTKTSGTTTS